MAFLWCTQSLNCLLKILTYPFYWRLNRKLYKWGCAVLYLWLHNCKYFKLALGLSRIIIWLFAPAPQKKKRPTSFADELAARIKGEIPVKQDEERSCKLTLKFWWMVVRWWRTPEGVGEENLVTVFEITQIYCLACISWRPNRRN